MLYQYLGGGQVEGCGGFSKPIVIDPHVFGYTFMARDPQKDDLTRVGLENGKQLSLIHI